MEDLVDDAPPGPTLACPLCAEPLVDFTQDSPPFVCPHCRGQFVVATVLGEDAAPADSPPETAREVELDGVRIRNLAALRRGAYRSRSYCLIAAAVAAVAAVQLGQMMRAALARHAPLAQPVGYGMMAFVAAIGCVIALSRAARFQREAHHASPTPAATPDFTALGDGSQRCQDLEHLVP